MKHKHADLIHAWADGAIIQWFHPSMATWIDEVRPAFDDNSRYRVKPITIKYRNFLWASPPGKPLVLSCTWDENRKDNRENWGGFVKWVSNWIEAEVE